MCLGFKTFSVAASSGLGFFASADGTRVIVAAAIYGDRGRGGARGEKEERASERARETISAKGSCKEPLCCRRRLPGSPVLSLPRGAGLGEKSCLGNRRQEGREGERGLLPTYARVRPWASRCLCFHSALERPPDGLLSLSVSLSLSLSLSSLSVSLPLSLPLSRPC